MHRALARSAAAWSLALALAGSGCRGEPSPSSLTTSDAGATHDFPVQVRDDLGRSVVVPARPRRILCLLPSFTETVFALGAGDQVVGVDDYSDYPPATQHLPKLGGLYDTQVERALALEPDLVLISEAHGAVAALASGGAAVWAGSPHRFEDVYRVIELTGTLLGRQREAAELVARLGAEIAAVEASVRSFPSVSVYYELDPAPYTVGPNSFMGVLLTKAGGRNIVPATLGDFPKINPELVVSSNPEVIIGASLDDVARRPGWGDLSAVKTRQVYAWSSAEAHLVSRPGPRLAEGLRALAQRLHPHP
ncbi:MAG: ABC transporter substrate-binding protein [Myxococcales bacterium]